MVGSSSGQRSGEDELDLDEEKCLELKFIVASSYGQRSGEDELDLDVDQINKKDIAKLVWANYWIDKKGRVWI